MKIAIILTALSFTFLLPTTVSAQLLNVTDTFHDYGFCCFTWSNDNMTIVGSIDTINKNMTQALAEQILTENGYRLQNYSTSSEGTHIVAAVSLMSVFPT